MGKRAFAALLCVLLCFAGALALADDYGQAVIDGRNATRVHLRWEPTTKSESQGLFFTGTEVTCKSDPDEEWVRVKIGRLDGYMMGKYLKRGSAADRVQPYTWTGYTTATNYARLRKGPSTEYQFICKVEPDDKIRIMGETDNHWYYAKVNGEIGFISGSVVRLTSGGDSSSSDSSGSSSDWSSDWSTPRPVQTPVPYFNTTLRPSADSWQMAYIRHIQQSADTGVETYGLIDVNGDNVPELAINSGAEAGGCEIVTYANGQLGKLVTSRLDFTYMPGGNLLGNCAGHMDYYFDHIYTIIAGQFVMVAKGDYSGVPDEVWSDPRYENTHVRELCTYYNWNGRVVSREEYIRSLQAVYNETYAKTPEFPYDRNSIIGVLYQMQ